ncbi:hypothetical protein DSL72_008365 [Monilinia vaccinii-corymbosi]|uniref:Myb-like DNA-binding domain-containing protein n=1 Tax=Monilinia vaccinii-corymbosi TaxID=61207 RepID=A0A8A3PKG9_9HELO|nr:hypothetical protein DSL72_008365 [Monilinia vaccinii-corymbosi]
MAADAEKQKLMTADAEKQKLVASIFSQVNIGSIDWDRVAKDLNTPTANAAQVQWRRFIKTLPNFDNELNGDRCHGTASPPNTPKKRQSPSKSKAAKGSPTKKQKRSRSGADSDDEEEELQFDKHDKEESKGVLPEAPARTLPIRKAKIKPPIKEVRIIYFILFRNPQHLTWFGRLISYIYCRSLTQRFKTVTSDEEEEEEEKVEKEASKKENLVEENTENGETQEMEVSVASGKAIIDSGSDFDGVEEV